MTNIRIHQCPSCGGNLTVDLERQMYHCSFCGSSFDYEYFREEEALEKGNKYLSRGEFTSASDLYKFLLDKDPHDFMALRGLMLASGRMKELGELYDMIAVENYSYDRDQAALVLDSASPDDKEYFDEMSKIYSDMKEVSDMVEEKNRLRQERKKFEDKINIETRRREEYYITGRSGLPHDPKSVFITMAIICGILYMVVIDFIIAGILSQEVYCGCGALLLLWAVPLTIIEFKVVLPRYKQVKAIDVLINEYSNESGTRRIKIRELDEKIDKASTSIKQACTALIRKDKKIMAQAK